MKESPGMRGGGEACAPARVRVWDLPTRVFHWSLVVAVACLVVTGLRGGELMAWHARAGYAVIALVLFRLIWGVAGGRWSRFARFVPTPRALLAYLRHPAPRESVGHSPLGGLSVVTFLLALALQAGTGLVSDDQAEFAGPLNAYVSNSAARLATRYHKGIGAPLLYAMVGLHLAAIVTYRVRRGWKLTQPMWTGDKLLAEGAPASRDDARARWLALGIATICAATVAALVAIVGSGGP